MARWETPRRGGLWVICSDVTRNQHLFHFSYKWETAALGCYKGKLLKWWILAFTFALDTAFLLRGTGHTQDPYE